MIAVASALGDAFRATSRIEDRMLTSSTRTARRSRAEVRAARRIITWTGLEDPEKPAQVIIRTWKARGPSERARRPSARASLRHRAHARARGCSAPKPRG